MPGLITECSYHEASSLGGLGLPDALVSFDELRNWVPQALRLMT